MMKCGFENQKECTDACKHFNTCARNPHRKDGDNHDKRRSIARNS